MKKRIKIIILIIIFIAILILLLSCITAINNKPQKTNNNELKSVKGIKQLDICKSPECHYESPIYFHKVYTKSDDPEIKNIVNNLNEKRDYYYNMMKNSTFDEKDCKDKAAIYNYSLYIDTQTSYAENERLFSAMINRKIYDICKNTSNSLEPDVINYDIIYHKEISQEELKAILDISDEQVDSAVKYSLETLSSEDLLLDFEKVNYKRVFIDKKNNIRVVFYIPELDAYKYATIKK